MNHSRDWMRSAAIAALLALPAAPAAFGQDADSDPEPDARVDYNPATMGEQQGPDGKIREGTVAAAIRDAVEGGALASRMSEISEGVISAAEQTYVMRVHDPIWDREGVSDFLDALDRAPEYGLRIAPSMIQRVQAAAETLSGSASTQARAEADLDLTAAFMSYADARLNGAVDPDSLEGIKFEKPQPEPLRSFLGAAGAGQFDHGRLDPDSDGFRNLQEILQVYRRHAENGGFTTIERDAVVTLGEASPVVRVLRQRLAEEGYDVDAPASVRRGTPERDMRMTPAEPGGSRQDAQSSVPEPETFDETMQAALEAFQEDHGLTVDGVLGPNTIEVLNQPVEEKIATIEANMERWRWAPTDMPDRHVRVNPPAFIAQGYQDGRPAITMEAIVGQGRRPTPMMADEIEYFVANPRWYVPESIFRKDKLERIRNNPGYLEENGYFVLERSSGDQVPIDQIDFSDDSVVEEYRLVQGPGPNNALGQIKFMFPNEHAIYLHDTPADHLFDREERAFSSGCVRLERPLDMAEWIVSENGGDLSYEEVRTAVNGDELQRLELATPLPVYLFYFTAAEARDGQAVFYEDIYGRDAELIAALEREAVSIGDSGGA
ncbi:MAG: L,D-transpeptidase family protein [Oceanicaulis sp.]